MDKYAELRASLDEALRFSSDCFIASNSADIRELLDDYYQQLDRADRFAALYEMWVNYVCRQLERHGIVEIDIPVEAIETLVSDKDKEISRLRGALIAFVDYAENHGEITFNGGGMKAVDALNEVTRKARAALAQVNL